MKKAHNGVSNTLKAANKVMDIWNNNPNFVMVSTSKDDMANAINALATSHVTVESKQTELDALQTQRDQAHATLNALVTRARSSIRGAYGPDSAQYGQTGCTRASDRQAVHRTKSTPALVQPSQSTTSTR